MKRRTFLRRSLAGLAATTVGVGLFTDNDESTVTAGTPPDDRTRESLLPGTTYQTPVVTIDADQAGPTALVVGGLHGDERSGYRAAEAVAEWSFDAGTVVVLPRANVPAIRRGTRENDNGDLNRKFTPTGEPETRLARAIWSLVEETEPDVVLDLHRSRGIYRIHPRNVGQAIFPTAAGDATAHAEATCSFLNDAEIPWSMPLHRFTTGGDMDGSAPLLGHKVGDDLGTPAYIVETTTFITDLQTRVDWTTAAAEHLLAKHGIERQPSTSAGRVAAATGGENDV
ncbi:succinylglutamate desuccinylase/aspartoacylase family protein [Haloarchaeobius sp. HME9146]|uniref:M99 family carboxypeptidase catalytic domain-containing protein n=1 Tax=Haloarchaeobius sp. HME9146 TaxID=2978732 RepID=UPI0021BE44ED|nr:succinylglutamate desuccinylase/aspartoacylase family protein [Haloarchaeobius sp. HME9146]MCT9096268.1 succinylglutamate desuccinylase/aspartoacylase family protein [Haloarchaeobius sp. HME9146]